MGLLAHVMGIRPWEVGRLTVEEFEASVEFCRQWNEAQKG